MEKENDLTYDQEIGERLKMIMEYLGLHVEGFAKLLEISSNHTYSILRGRRKFTQDRAKILSDKISSISQSEIFDLNSKIKSNIGDSEWMQGFRENYKNNREFFVESWEERKLSTLIRNKLLYKNYFMNRRTVAEVRKACMDLGEVHISEKITKRLLYLVKIGLIFSEKVPIVLKGGGKGDRLINVYWQEEKF
ncbi:helix-turn-helix transcriptional regulator [Echinicola sp. 20G]|uniref:helix-turn-helix domain-containing protein n=1 Tax=Echinicola sp. 20G TaxID=2781961 RepID=UPI0019107BF8|nr:helix-turn-helix transcriptional regulator [Echinicola sp. 20G]